MRQVTATVLQKHPDGVSRWVHWGARLRGEDAAFTRVMVERDEEFYGKALEQLQVGVRIY